MPRTRVERLIISIRIDILEPIPRCIRVVHKYYVSSEGLESLWTQVYDTYDQRKMVGSE